MTAAQIGRGHVFHSRHEGAKHTFRYPTFFIYFSCDQESALRDLFRSQFFRFLSFSSLDYLRGESAPIDQLIKKFLRETCQYTAESVWLHTLPRMLGYAFNPVSFWVCRRGGGVDAVLVEVNNTFGERHFYWIQPANGIQSQTWYTAKKVFHVSPFFPIDGFYKFRFQFDGHQIRVDINFNNSVGLLRLATWVQGDLSELSQQTFFSIFAKYGWMTPMVILRIHLHALKLVLKRQRFYSKPPLPREEVTRE